MDYLSYGTLGPATPGPGRRYEPNRYSSMPVRPAGTGPRHLAADPEPPVVREHPPRRLGDSARSGRGWPLVADDLFFVAHDDWPHKLRLHRDVARLGLGAAVIAELVLARYIDIRGDALVAIVHGRPADPVAARLMTRLLDEPRELPVRDWLAYLADPDQPDGDIYEQVARRMLLAGRIRTERTGLLLRSRRYVPADISTAAWAWMRLSQQLDSGTPLNDVDTVLGGLILATDLHLRLLTGHSGAFAARLRGSLAAAPTAIRELQRHTQDAVGSAVGTVA